MRIGWKFFITSVLLFVFLVNFGLAAVDKGGINKVRNKPMLENSDSKVIDKFVAEAVADLVKAKDFASIARIRAVITSHSRSGVSSNQAQYQERFYQSAYKYISEAFKTADELMPEDRKFKVVLNLLILVDQLQNVQLIDLAVPMLNDNSSIIRYWAVRVLTNSNLAKQLNSSGAGKTKIKEIIGHLMPSIASANVEKVSLVAEFAAAAEIKQGDELLLAIAQMRMQKYIDWTVDFELLDDCILRLLYDKMTIATSDKADLAGAFAQLYSYVLQRYVKGADILSKTQKHHLASVLLETEKDRISRLLMMPQWAIKRAIEMGDYATLMTEHERLLGSQTKAGELVSKLNFDYGKTADGKKQTWPKTLPDPPEKN